MKLAEAAAMLGVQPATLRQQIRAKRLRARRMGRDWFVTRADLERYRAAYRRDKQPAITIAPLDEIRFWQKVSKGPEHWTVSSPSTAYGTIFVDGTSIRAHRFSWILHNGPIPAGVQVRHVCDEASCVRPDHLYLG